MASPALMEELVEEALLRIPPDDPASLVRAALVCKEWRRIVTGPGFRRRFRELHRRPPTLGVFCNMDGEGCFCLSASSLPLPARLRLTTATFTHSTPATVASYFPKCLRWLASAPGIPSLGMFGTCPNRHFPAFTHGRRLCSVLPMAPATTLTVTADPSSWRRWRNGRIVCTSTLRRLAAGASGLEDGGLGVARLEKYRLDLWSNNSSAGDAQWSKIGVIQLQTLLPVNAAIADHVVAFAHGVGVFFVGTDKGLFSIDLKSRQARKVCNMACGEGGIHTIVPYMSFCTPALRMVSTGDGPNGATSGA
ncbi:hypothetical protein PR202_ga28534 [Eleusine coracana subsp. coracana]|uniref:F-box domain-containing protein n=1 Tax=Eleusine coracana subsp. coracana TaxID=191504 RepID=A0AAV5DJN4_ELECO|nr:hypothetical protein PR202_ga28534 [Eleusine coracana subsp. coracana]